MAKPKEVKSTHETTSGTGHRDKDPGIVQRSQKLFEVFGKLGRYLAIGLGVFALIYFWYKKDESAETQVARETAEAAREDSGWYWESTDDLLEKRDLALTQGREKTITIPGQYRFRVSCSGKVEIRFYGMENPVLCDLTPGITAHITEEDGLKLIDGRTEVKFIGQQDAKVSVRRWPKFQ